MKLLVGAIWSCVIPATLAFEWAAGGKRPDINHQSIAGLWKLTKPTPLKEFTVRPRKPKTPDTEVLLMLKEDGSFQQYKSELDDADDGDDIDMSWQRFQQSCDRANLQSKKSFQSSFLRGTWDYVDGKLFLAADRPSPPPTTSKEFAPKASSSSLATADQQDTLLVGHVIATYETSLSDNPVLGNNETTASIARKDEKEAPVDTKLSVPFGSVNVGKFFYPRHHPSFFEQPMFRPRKHDVVCLKQVLGNLNARQTGDELVEKYKRSDFYNKTFLLTSHPLQHHYKGKKRWSIKFNKYVYDKSDAIKQEEEDEAQRMANIRVVQIAFHGNNTFSTVAGLGSDVILRGKFDVIGRDRDQLWMQVWRFGFGRSVSGSVYSEGKSLTQDDAKTYWGSIAEEEVALPPTEEEEISPPIHADSRKGTVLRLEVKGSVMLGWGLEPQPVARFIMREAREADIVLSEDDEEEDDDDNDEDNNDGGGDFMRNVDSLGVSEDGIDMSGNDAFQ